MAFNPDIEVAFSIVSALSVEVEIDTGLKNQPFTLKYVKTVVSSAATATTIATRLGEATGFVPYDSDQKYSSVSNSLASIPTSYSNGPSTLDHTVTSDANGKLWARFDLEISGNAAGVLQIEIVPRGY